MRHDLCSSTTVSAVFADCGCDAYGASCAKHLHVFRFKLHRLRNLECLTTRAQLLCNTSTSEAV